jgi:hypothetical protein
VYRLLLQQLRHVEEVRCESLLFAALVGEECFRLR